MNINLDKSYNFLIPYNVPMIRLGNAGDGGYVIPKSALLASDLISLGVGSNWTFDKHWQLLKPNSNIHAYDGTIDPNTFNPDLKQDYENFFKDRVVHFKENVDKHNIGSIIKKTNRSIFLKIDIEGYEYDILPEIYQASNILGMAIEFHVLSFVEQKKKFIEIINRLNTMYRIVHVHANNYGGICDDQLPHTLEISFLKKNLCSSNVLRHSAYLPEFDTPNALISEEYKLYFNGEDI